MRQPPPAQPALVELSTPEAVPAPPGATGVPAYGARPAAAQGSKGLLGPLVALALPILVEQVLHVGVGVTDVYLAGHLREGAAPATAAVGVVSYVLWLIGVIAGTIGTGSTAVIARAVGGRHRSLANAVCGQTVIAALVAGVALAAVVRLAAGPIANVTQLTGEAHGYALYYLRVLSLSLPFSILLFAANSCLRGAGDTRTPAVAMVLVDAINIVLSAALSRGWLGLPEMGFRGIAIGTVVAYVVGGGLQLVVLFRGRGGIRLFPHRLRPHWHTLRRILRVGLPSGLSDLLGWVANFGILSIINRIDPNNLAGAAHIVTIRLESFSFLIGFAVATAAATLVGQSLGMKRPDRAKRAAYLAFALGGGFMICCGVLFVLFPRPIASLLAGDAAVAALSADCLRVTGFCQAGFAAALIFGGALRGAGDTLTVMAINLACVLGLRLAGVLIVALYFKQGLTAIWVVLAAELMIRGLAIYARFAHGGWRHVKV